MKKLLGMLSAIGLSVVTGTSIMSCAVHKDLSRWDANEILGEVMILEKKSDNPTRGKNTQEDLDVVVYGNWTYDELFNNEGFLPKLVYRQVIECAYKKIDDAKILNIHIDITKEEIKDEEKGLMSWIKEWAVEGIRLVGTGSQTTPPILKKDMHGETLNQYLEDHKKNGMTGFGISFDMRHSTDKVKDLQSAGNNQWGAVTTASLWTFKLN